MFYYGSVYLSGKPFAWLVVVVFAVPLVYLALTGQLTLRVVLIGVGVAILALSLSRRRT